MATKYESFRVYPALSELSEKMNIINWSSSYILSCHLTEIERERVREIYKGRAVGANEMAHHMNTNNNTHSGLCLSFSLHIVATALCACKSYVNVYEYSRVYNMHL